MRFLRPPQKLRSKSGFACDLPAEITSSIERLYQQDELVDSRGVKQRLSATSLRREEAEAISRLILVQRPKATLEIGLGLGASALAIATAKRYLGDSLPHVALDPFQHSRSAGVGMQVLETAGLSNLVQWVEDFSERYLPSLVAAGKQFEFIFVDGAHDIGQVVMEAFWIKQLLTPGGIVAFHDGLLRSASYAVRHLVEENDYKVLDLALGTTGRAYRMIAASRHLPAIGWWYYSGVVPRMVRSVVALQRPFGGRKVEG
jgi:predicted O-methyltransferase YrrM